MPEIYDGRCKYQVKVQTNLQAIALGIRDSAECRAFLLQGTIHQDSYAKSTPLWREQWAERDPKDKMICPFWSNYWYEPCRSCSCRIDKSVSMEIDAVFFLQNADGNRLALHIEMKRDNEPLSVGQAEAYRPRASCYRDQRRQRKGLLAHDHFLTILLHGIGTDTISAKMFFDRVISHDNAKKVISGYSAG